MTVSEFDVAVVMARELSVAVMVKVPVLVICRLLNVATPLIAATDVVPPAKLPVFKVSPMVSVDPVPEFTTLLNWSSTVALRPTVPPAVIELAGWAVITTLFGAAGLTPNEFVVAVLTPLRLVSEAVIA